MIKALFILSVRTGQSFEFYMLFNSQVVRLQEVSRKTYWRIRSKLLLFLLSYEWHKIFINGRILTIEVPFFQISIMDLMVCENVKIILR